ncbi:hypothetical protein [Pseudalkalibacillus decolorationis]|uniref:hypothetical protein n=1 Tax=Pseudalkalibacillus decolorationis TaxID=163879 RepID=UPI0021497FAD|nr:hypothetical protein [Pseudalkalibacillus decolorationis]
MYSFRKYFLYSCIFGDSLLQNVFPDRKKPIDQILCILIQAIFVFVFCIPLAFPMLAFILILSPYPNIPLLEVYKYIYFLLVLIFMVPILLNQSNREYSIPKVLIEVHFIFVSLTRRIEIKIFSTLITFVLLITIVNLMVMNGVKILSYYPQLQGNHILFGGVVFILILMMLFLEATNDELKRTFRQFVFWLIIFFLFLGFSFTQINLYILPQLDNENFINAIIILIGIMFNFAQVLSSGRTAYNLALKQVKEEGLIESAYNEAFTYSEFIRIVGDYKSTQKQLFNEIKDEIKRIGLQKFIIKMLPFFSLIIFILFVYTILLLNSKSIETFLQILLDFLINSWVSLLGGNKELAMYLFFLLLLFYFFFKQLSVLLKIIKEKHFIPIFTQIEIMLMTLIAIFVFIDIILIDVILFNFVVMPLFIITIILGVSLSIIKKFTRYKSQFSKVKEHNNNIEKN